jgi:hypothetical protein
MGRNFVKLAGRLNVGTHKIGTGKGSVEISDIQTAIQDYGIISEWRVNTAPNGRFSLLGNSSFYTWIINVALLYPAGQSSQDNREVRTELYLQAESIMETLKQLKVQFINPPQIILGGDWDHINGTLAVEFNVLYGELARSGCTGPHC